MPMQRPNSSHGWTAEDWAASRAGGGNGGGTAEHGTPPQADVTTTLMFRGLRKQSSEGEFLQELGRYCRLGDYDFVYIPWDSKRDRNMGYAFVNFVQPQAALETFNRMDGQPWRTACRKAAAQTWQPKQHYHHLQTAHVQGLPAIFAYLAGTSVLQEECQHPPMVFSNGARASLQEFQQRFPKICIRTNTTAEAQAGLLGLDSTDLLEVSPPPASAVAPATVASWTGEAPSFLAGRGPAAPGDGGTAGPGQAQAPLGRRARQKPSAVPVPSVSWAGGGRSRDAGIVAAFGLWPPPPQPPSGSGPLQPPRWAYQDPASSSLSEAVRSSTAYAQAWQQTTAMLNQLLQRYPPPPETWPMTL